MGQQQNTSTQQSSTASSDPNVTSTIDKLLGGVSSAADAGPSVFNSSLYAGVGPTTTQGWNSALSTANNPTYSTDVQGAIGSLGNAAAGNDYGTNDPGYATLRSNAANDAQTLINQQFNNSGRLGGMTADKALGTGVTNAIAGLDYTNFQNDRAFQQSSAAALPSLFQASLLPSATQASIGSAQDANSEATLQGNYDLSTRQANAKTDLLAKLTSILAGNASAAGTNTNTTASTPATPWYQSLLGGLVALA